MFKFKMIYGVLLCSVLALAALLISKYIPIGMVTLAIILGIIIGNTLKLSVTFQQGITYSEKNIPAFQNLGLWLMLMMGLVLGLLFIRKEYILHK